MLESMGLDDYMVDEIIKELKAHKIKDENEELPEKVQNLIQKFINEIEETQSKKVDSEIMEQELHKRARIILPVLKKRLSLAENIERMKL